MTEQKTNLAERFEFRAVRPEEAEWAAEIEQICFPPNEACSRERMMERVVKAPELFFVAVDKKTGKIAGFLNGLTRKSSGMSFLRISRCMTRREKM